MAGEVHDAQFWNDPEDGKKPDSLPFSGTMPFVDNDQFMTRCATHTFKVWDSRDKLELPLKDTWGVESCSIDHDDQVYATLEVHRVWNIPKCLRLGDVNLDHCTCAQDSALAGSGSRGHVHYRLLLREVCRGNVTEFKDTKELVAVIRDSLIAHHNAYQKAGLLHRHVSVCNILITENGTGRLVDWGLAKSTSELDKAKQPERTGTWQFISAVLLSKEATYPKLVDDLESYFHVLGWIVLRYTKHSEDGASVARHLRRGYDDSYEENSGRVLGDTGKIVHMRSAALARFGFFPGPLANLIIDLEKTCAARYAKDPDPRMVSIAVKALLNEGLSAKEREYHRNNPDYRTHELRKCLSSETWFIERVNEALWSEWSNDALERCQIKLPKDDSTYYFPSPVNVYR